MMAGREVCMEFECTLPEDEGEEEQRWLGEVLVNIDLHFHITA